MNLHTEEEGVIKFDLQFSVAGPVSMDVLDELNTWRSILWKQRLIGQDPSRYGGYGYGNVSQRIGPRMLLSNADNIWVKYRHAYGREKNMVQ